MFKLSTTDSGDLSVELNGELVLFSNTTYDQLCNSLLRSLHRAISQGSTLSKEKASTIFLRTSKPFSNIPSEIWAVLEHTTLGTRFLVMVDTCLLALLRSNKGSGSIGYMKLLPAQLKNVKEFKEAIDEEAESLHCRVVDFVTSANVAVRSNTQVIMMGLGGECSYITLDVKGIGEVHGVRYKDI